MAGKAGYVVAFWWCGNVSRGRWWTYSEHREDERGGWPDRGAAGDALDGVQDYAVRAWDVLGQWGALRLRDGGAHGRSERGAGWEYGHGFCALSGGGGGPVVLGEDASGGPGGGDASGSQGTGAGGECGDRVEQHSAVSAA